VKLFGLAGWSGAGKTTLMRRLIPELVGRGYAVSTVKHAHDGFEIDLPGKDSYEHRKAGATEVLISSARRFAIIHEHRGAPEPDLDELVKLMAPVDLLVIEGFKRHGHDKIEVHRAANGKPYLHPEDPRIVAVASDGPVPGANRPVFFLDAVPAIADFMLVHCGLPPRKA
jgi:molybdopterin-guanine dinucleotide biosynthesis protein B